MILCEKYHATWINYEAQLEKSNIIYDEKNLCGLYAIPYKMSE